MTLTWSSYNDPIFGDAEQLDGLPEGMNALARLRGDRFVANGFVYDRFIHCEASTLREAKRRFERELRKLTVDNANTGRIVVTGSERDGIR